jgi:hypothetical protein
VYLDLGTLGYVLEKEVILWRYPARETEKNALTTAYKGIFPRKQGQNNCGDIIKIAQKLKEKI